MSNEHTGAKYCMACGNVATVTAAKYCVVCGAIFDIGTQHQCHDWRPILPTEPPAAAPAPNVPDPNVEAVIQQHRARAEAGYRKYGTTTQRGDLSISQWLQHMQDELMDAAVYNERLKGDISLMEQELKLLREFYEAAQAYRAASVNGSLAACLSCSDRRERARLAVENFRGGKSESGTPEKQKLNGH